MCTTFELRSEYLEKSWSYLQIVIHQNKLFKQMENQKNLNLSLRQNKGISFIVITHERGELPFSAYDRHIHTIVPPGESISLYFSKSITNRLNTARNPCHAGLDARFLAFGTSNMNNDNWASDYLDLIRSPKWKNKIYQNFTHMNQLSFVKSKTISLFGTHFLYSREACGWAECCAKVRLACNCTCTLDLLAPNRTYTPVEFKCEQTQCQDEQISYEKCPLPCSQTKFIKHSEVRSSNLETNYFFQSSSFKLIRSESVQVATEEEIFSLAKLFSEVGGLCSLFIGFSCIFIFELFEALILIYFPHKQQIPKQTHYFQTNLIKTNHPSDTQSQIFNNLFNYKIQNLNFLNNYNNINFIINKHQFGQFINLNYVKQANSENELIYQCDRSKKFQNVYKNLTENKNNYIFYLNLFENQIFQLEPDLNFRCGSDQTSDTSIYSMLN